MPQTKAEITKQFGESLQRHLAAAGMSGYELAKRAGVAEGTVYGCISGRTALRLTTLYKLAQALGVTACTLLEGPPPHPEAPQGEQPTGKAGEKPPTDRAERAPLVLTPEEWARIDEITEACGLKRVRFVARDSKCRKWWGYQSRPRTVCGRQVWLTLDEGLVDLRTFDLSRFDDVPWIDTLIEREGAQ